jgi:glucose/arabinose dehydrogenase
MRRIVRSGWALALVALLSLGSMASALSAATLPTGFSDALLATVPQPIDLAVAPAGPQRGAMFVTGKAGTVHRIAPGSGTARQGLDLRGRTCSEGERRMLGIALDPKFGRGADAVYLYYTARDGQCRNRLSRFMVRANGTIAAGSEQVLIQTAPLIATNHNGRDIGFGADGNLYVAIGDNARPDLAQQRNTYFGKILRVRTDGSAARGNPYTAKKGAKPCGLKGRTKAKACREIFALGLRNPFQFAFVPGTSTFFINDVGQRTWEEINRSRKGANYGWPLREGPCPQGQSSDCTPAPARFDDPVAFYSHQTGCRSITGGAFVPAASDWPEEYRGAYLFGDFVCGKIFMLPSPLGAPGQPIEFATAAGPMVGFQFDPADPGALLYTSLSGEVRRITYD